MLPIGVQLSIQFPATPPKTKKHPPLKSAPVPALRCQCAESQSPNRAHLANGILLYKPCIANGVLLGYNNGILEREPEFSGSPQKGDKRNGTDSSPEKGKCKI